jgi:hypothetical protein
MLVRLQRPGDTWKTFRGRYILLQRTGITLNIFRERYVLLPRAGIAWWSSDQAATVVASTTGKGAALASVRLVGMGSATTVVAGPTGESAALASVRLVGMGSASNRGGGSTGEGAALASVRLVGVGSASHLVGMHDRRERCSGLCSLGRHGLSQPLWRHGRHVRTLLWPLFAWSAWAQPDTVVAGTAIKGADLASVRLFGMGSASHRVGEHDS